MELVALPSDADASTAIKQMRDILQSYAQKGVPEDLVAAAIRSEVASADFQRTSIPGLANVWSNALAAEGRNSPDEDIEAIKHVTIADVNRVAKQFLVDQNSITSILKPVPTGQPVSAKGFGGAEEVTSAPTKPVQLPAWAAGPLSALKPPQDFTQGLRHQTVERHSPDREDRSNKPHRTVVARVKHQSDLETPPGQEGVSEVLDGCSPTEPSVSTGSHSRKRWTTLPPVKVQASVSRSMSSRIISRVASSCSPTTSSIQHYPADAFTVVQKQTAQVIAGRSEQPGLPDVARAQSGVAARWRPGAA